jgi:nitrous oxide reductase
MPKNTSRRDFLQQSALSALAVTTTGTGATALSAAEQMTALIVK